MTNSSQATPSTARFTNLSAVLNGSCAHRATATEGLKLGPDHRLPDGERLSTSGETRFQAYKRKQREEIAAIRPAARNALEPAKTIAQAPAAAPSLTVTMPTKPAAAQPAPKPAPVTFTAEEMAIVKAAQTKVARQAAEKRQAAINASWAAVHAELAESRGIVRADDAELPAESDNHGWARIHAEIRERRNGLA